MSCHVVAFVVGFFSKRVGLRGTGGVYVYVYSIEGGCL